MSAAGKDPRKVVQGWQSRTRGGEFEERITASCKLLAEKHAAYISKTPEPMKPLSRPNAYGQFKACYTKKAEPDFKGVIAGGRAIMFEAKSTASDRMEQSRVIPEQAAVLDEHEELGALCFVLVQFASPRAYRIPWRVWRDMKNQYGRKYIKEEDVKNYALPFGAFMNNDITYQLLYGIETRGERPNG